MIFGGVTAIFISGMPCDDDHGTCHLLKNLKKLKLGDCYQTHVKRNLRINLHCIRKARQQFACRCSQIQLNAACTQFFSWLVELEEDELQP